jgi:hypothetical protein|tara:strand:+ start:143 stop:583 length:441 start_codon:yes stop_codon:yes gene_type:complete
MTNKIQTTKLINAELKNGDFYKYLWLGNDYFADLFNSWDFESDEGKYKGLYDFDVTFCRTIEQDEIKDEESIIGVSFDTELEDSEIVDFTLEDVIWEQEEKFYTVDLGSIGIDEEQYQELEKIGFDDWILKNINRVELDQIIGEED